MIFNDVIELTVLFIFFLLLFLFCLVCYIDETVALPVLLLLLLLLLLPIFTCSQRIGTKTVRSPDSSLLLSTIKWNRDDVE